MSKLSVAAAAFVSASAAGGVDQNDRPSDTSSAHLGSLPPPPHTAAAALHQKRPNEEGGRARPGPAHGVKCRSNAGQAPRSSAAVKRRGQAPRSRPAVKRHGWLRLRGRGPRRGASPKDSEIKTINMKQHKIILNKNNSPSCGGGRGTERLLRVCPSNGRYTGTCWSLP